MADLITSDELEKRLTDPSNLLNRLAGQVSGSSDYVRTEEPAEVNVLPMHQGGRGEVPNIPHPVQAMIGVMARLDTAEHVGEAFGVSKQQVHNLKHGRTTDLHGQNPRLVSDMTAKRTAIADAGLAHLIEAVQSFKIDEIVDESKKVQAAAQLANIIDKMVPAEKEGSHGNSVVVNLFAPRMKDLDEYEIIEVQAEEVE